MQPHARVARCFFQWERIFLEICGHNFFGESYEPNGITYLTYSLIVIAFLCEIYTIAVYDMSSKFFCMVQMLLVLQVSFFIIAFFKSYYKI